MTQKNEAHLFVSIQCTCDGAEHVIYGYESMSQFNQHITNMFFVQNFGAKKSQTQNFAL
jgi:hypothetical protein